MVCFLFEKLVTQKQNVLEKFVAGEPKYVLIVAIRGKI